MNFSLGCLWQPCRDGARLLKVYGDTPCPVVPGQIEGLPVIEIGPYCFAEKNRRRGSFPCRMACPKTHSIASAVILWRRSPSPTA